MLVMTGIADDAPARNRHIIRSDDGRCALWVGAVDDLWAFGKPVGRGGPWKNTKVKAGEPSDPYLMTGYDRKLLHLVHHGRGSVTIRIEVDIDGTGYWRTYESFDVSDHVSVMHRFPDAFGAYWVRAVASKDTVVTAQLTYR
jgi:hypothetical protein